MPCFVWGAIIKGNKMAAVPLVHTKPVLITHKDKLLYNTELKSCLILLLLVRDYDPEYR